jgi:hypothetical protein
MIKFVNSIVKTNLYIIQISFLFIFGTRDLSHFYLLLATMRAKVSSKRVSGKKTVSDAVKCD